MLRIDGNFKRSKQAEIMQEHFAPIIEIAKAISLEFSNSHLYSSILDEAQKISNADGGTLYLLNENKTDPALEIILMKNTKGIIGGTSTDTDYTFNSIKLNDPKTGHKNESNISSYTANTGHIVSIDDIYDTDGFDFSGAHQFDKDNDFHTKSILSIPLNGTNNHIIGVLQLINFRNEENELIGFDEKSLPLIEALASFATLAMEKQLMVDSQEDLLIRLASEPSPDHLFERILDEAQEITNADGGTLYLLKADEPPRLEFAIMRNNSLELRKGGTSKNKIEYKPLPLYDYQGDENHNNVATHVALSKTVVNISDAYKDKNFDFSGTKKVDQITGYRSRSFLTIPMMNHNQEVIGVLQLLNAEDPKTNEVIAFNPKLEPIIKALTFYASIMLSNQLYIKEIKDLMDAFVKCIAQAIDAKSSHTSAHCQRVPKLMELMVNAACDDKEHIYKNFSLSEEERYEIMVSAWMHDCGKLSTPDRVLDKSTKLHSLIDGIEIVKARFASKRQQLGVDFVNEKIKNPDQKDALKQQFILKIKVLTDDLKFIEQANKGKEYMSDEDQARVKEIGNQQWFDCYGEKQNLLSDDEICNLCIARGTINKEEREIINNHMAVTIDMLTTLPFPKNLKRVPEYAGGHHEKIDGTGFPKGITGDQMSIPAKMMAIADIFEALSSKERPYKEPMKLSQSLSILSKMSKTGHIDPDLFHLFLQARVWEIYSKKYCLPEQLDVDDLTAFY